MEQAKTFATVIASAVVSALLTYQGAHLSQGPVQPQSVADAMVHTIERISLDLAACRMERGEHD